MRSGWGGRDAPVIALIGGAHFLSHFFQLVLPPLFPLLREAFEVPYVALGLLMSAFYAASGIGQPVSGFLVDRFGAARVLVAGLGLVAAAIALVGVSPSYALLVPLAMLGGFGNSVFHPADYSLLNATVEPRYLGRAYSAHGIGGNLGWVAAPPVVVTLSGVFGWRAALVVVGGLGVAVALFLASRRRLWGEGWAQASAPTGTAPARVAQDVRQLFATPILMAFAYFVLLAAALSAVQTFSVAALVSIYGAPLGLATSALTGYFLGNAAGILAGGVLADRARRHDFVAAGGLLLAGVLFLTLASGRPPGSSLLLVMAAAGFCKGVTQPSRDVLVRGATPPGASGRVFGFVYAGLDLGALLMPPVYGWLMDQGAPRAVFAVAAGVTLLCIVTVLQVRRQSVLAAAAH